MLGYMNTTNRTVLLPCPRIINRRNTLVMSYRTSSFDSKSLSSSSFNGVSSFIGRPFESEHLKLKTTAFSPIFYSSVKQTKY